MLSVRALHAWYDESHVLHGVDLDVNKGEVVTLVGRNGAGKTTTLKSICGIVRRKTGEIALRGRRIETLAPYQVAHQGVAYVPEERGIFAGLTVRENLLLPPIVGAGWPLDRIYELFPILRERAKAPGTALSGGEQQMLAIARALRSGGELMLLDEPTEGLAPNIVATLRDVVREMKRSGLTVLLVEQNVRFATKVSDRHYLMANGRVVETLSNDEVVRREDELLEHLGV